MFDTRSILQRAAEKGAFERVRYVERNIPTSITDVTIMSFFGDIRSTFILSSLFLKRYKEEVKGSKYFILLSWPGYESLFPYVDEYWTFRDQAAETRLRAETAEFDNTSGIDVLYKKQINYFFDDHVDSSIIKPYYNRGIQQEFFERFNNIKCFLPAVSSAVAAGTEFIKQLATREVQKVFIYPAQRITTWRKNHLMKIIVPQSFWIGLCGSLLDAGYLPIIYKDCGSYDISTEFAEKCLYMREQNISKVVAAMRAVGCVIDVFSGISKLAIVARCPFIVFEERSKFSVLKDYEIDDLCAQGIPREYVYGFSTIIDGADEMGWKSNIYYAIIGKLDKFVPDLERATWPSTSESNEVVPYTNVRTIKSKKLGTRFIKVQQD